MLSTLEITHAPHRAGRRRRLRLHIACVCIAGLALFLFSVLHGINRTDSHYATELILAWSLALLGGYSGIRAFKRGRRSQRLIILIALALIGTSLFTVTFLNRTPEFSLPGPSSPDE